MVRVSARVQELKRICWLIVAGLLTACSPPPPFTDSQNQPVALADFAGKPLLVNYFAPWCTPCLREIPLLEALAREGQTAVVMVNYDPATPAELAKLAGQYHIEVPLLIARQEASLPFPRPAGLPTSYLLDGEGKLQQTLVGELTPSRLKALRASVKAVGH
ncbi:MULTISPECIES: TlpA family protein disulfide reductase [Aeromonas]|uniref:TlpA family protein disulfide reductase n=1 Tax=Aeromonas TaxID=642 RepID=UPI0005CDFEF2|nr:MULTISPECIES: TlpA disulfide reductase family protein [Aeromonas]AJQ54247.1 thioredoxin [Aeromonas hydrophila]MCR3950484.1 TlpA family protein disulfide reductase [Aeromonas hydrophila]MCW4614718.1 TlpA family protein disulfide reductase [Aeromonas hydrophila]HAU4884484.1 TlpA family protein disulfide reductase [Aeromonas hydrophila]